MKRRVRSTNDYVTIRFNKSEKALVEHFARTSAPIFAKEFVDGKSYVRKDPAKRATKCGTDQLVARSCELAILLHSRDMISGLCEFIAIREERDKPENRQVGDGGQDSIEDPFDIKGRYRDPEHRFGLAEYVLPVRPGERHKDTVYILGIAVPDPDGTISTVHLVGWLPEDELPPEFDSQGNELKPNGHNGIEDFDGAWCRTQGYLYTMDSFPYMRTTVPGKPARNPLGISGEEIKRLNDLMGWKDEDRRF
jgi:hypothetical protein